MMVLYEVNLTVANSIIDEYRAWLAKHVEEMLALPGFVDAQWFEDTGGADDGHTRWTIHYHLENQAAFDRYLHEFAPTMRGDGLNRFEGRFSAERRVLRPVSAPEPRGNRTGREERTLLPKPHAL